MPRVKGCQPCVQQGSITFRILTQLGEDGAQPRTQLCEKVCGVGPFAQPTFNESLRRLEKQGFVTIGLVAMTPAGLAALEAAEKRHKQEAGG